MNKLEKLDGVVSCRNCIHFSICNVRIRIYNTFFKIKREFGGWVLCKEWDRMCADSLAKMCLKYEDKEK